MSIAVVADSHLGGPGGVDPAPLIRQLDELPDRGCRRLFLLGDIFHVWIADPRFETPVVAELMAAVDRLRRRGVAVDYVEGNRDFFVAEGGYGPRFDRVGLELEADTGDRRIVVSHGDRIDDSDVQYRAWRWVSKSAPVRWAIRLLPPALAGRLALRIEAFLANTNFRHKRGIPEEIVRRFGASRLGGEADLLILGHFHEHRSWQVPGGEVRIVEAWFHHHHVEWIADPGGEAPAAVGPGS